MTNEVDTLIDALDAWEAAAAMPRMVSDFAYSLIFESGSQGEAKAKARQAKLNEAMAKLCRDRRDRAIVLKAKLLQIAVPDSAPSAKPQGAAPASATTGSDGDPADGDHSTDAPAEAPAESSTGEPVAASEEQSS